jgi:hypothetical protein
MYVGRGASREVHLLPVTDRPGSDHRGLTRLIRGVISRGMIPHDRAASTDPSATSDHPERKHRRHRRPNKWSNHESGGSSRDARANHWDPHRARHVVPIALSFFFLSLSQLLRFASTTSGAMKLSNQSEVPVYTISGSNTSRPLPEWLARRRKRSLKDDPEYANRVELLQDFEFEEASQCVRASEDGEWVMSTGMIT